jgi:hypothetical protein
MLGVFCCLRSFFFSFLKPPPAGVGRPLLSLSLAHTTMLQRYTKHTTKTHLPTTKCFDLAPLNIKTQLSAPSPCTTPHLIRIMNHLKQNMCTHHASHDISPPLSAHLCSNLSSHHIPLYNICQNHISPPPTTCLGSHSHCLGSHTHCHTSIALGHTPIATHPLPWVTRTLPWVTHPQLALGHTPSSALHVARSTPTGCFQSQSPHAALDQ